MIFLDLKFLAEIKEWAAYGFYEAEALQLPYPRNYGLAYRRLYENMRIRIEENSLIIPIEPLYKAKNRSNNKEHHCVNSILNFFHSYGLVLRSDIAKEKKDVYPQYCKEIDELCDDLRLKLVVFTQYIHSNPDTYTILEKGFNYLKNEIDLGIAQSEADNDQDSLQFLLALKDYTIGIDTYYINIKNNINNAMLKSEGQRKQELKIIYDAFCNCFYEPATSFVGGLLAVNLLFMLDGCDGIGRFDYALGGLFEQDINSGELNIDFARRLLDEFFVNFENMNAWNLQLGGYKPDGSNLDCLLTKECLECAIRNNYTRPNIALRVNKHTPDETLELALKCLSYGSGKPAIYNDDLYMKLIQENIPNLPYEDAVMYGFGGCTETMITGMSCVESIAGQINTAKALELCLFNGIDISNNTQEGPTTGNFVDFNTFDEFLEAYKKQIEFMTKKFVHTTNADIKRRMSSGDPKISRSLFTRGCIENKKSFEAGGAKYNYSIVSYDGTSVVIDSLAAVKDLVFDKKEISKEELIKALYNNFDGYESIQNKLQSAPKFGNDIEYVDSIGADILKYMWELLLTFNIPRGNGKHVPSIILFTTYEYSGKSVVALPNGRKAFEVLNDSTGACAGCDENGPTALLNSLLRLPLQLAFGTPVVNLRFNKQMLATENGIKKISNLIRNYFSRQGLQIQISVINQEDLLKAQLNPEKYKDIIVRIGGFSEYFVNLSKGLQDSVIKRTEHQ